MTVAAALIAADLALQRGITGWHGAGAPPVAVVQPAVTEQRIELRMARDPRLERGVLAKLPRRLARDVADDVAARRDLLLLAPHKHVSERASGRIAISVIYIFGPRTSGCARC